ncbi:glutamate racemase [Paenibacillus darwinianus]|uniref:Glutamate racemase n=1 Tax=Paenibacillus darwinianus TaxID=1380763 RepID=A0A9W5W7V8_9BACL|nr:glutamate racemase [Paenibacillus darwinianus]EXX88461.1 glutamate racemase [Paenibacillus darwinianus]EXX89291.1 glutamate racemase [Paenibacillus darwinianus]EXX90007.1 glutamate racemase [Paenibacillus darwinianus]
MTIGFFDSGIGGLSVLAESLRRLPAQNYLYMADTLHVPYGTKSMEEVKAFIHEAIAAMIQEGIDALVVACNTATSIAVEELRTLYSIPVVGMEPAVKPAVEMNRATGKRVLVFATPLTLQLPKYYALVSRVDERGIVDSLPMPELVRYCEDLQFDKAVMKDYFLTKLSPYNLDDYGIIVLGCTHYPFYTDILRGMLPPHIRIVDGNAGTVKRLTALLHRFGIADNGLGGGNVRFMCSGGDPAYLEKMRFALEFIRGNVFRTEDAL